MVQFSLLTKINLCNILIHSWARYNSLKAVIKNKGLLYCEKWNTISLLCFVMMSHTCSISVYKNSQNKVPYIFLLHSWIKYWLFSYETEVELLSWHIILWALCINMFLIRTWLQLQFEASIHFTCDRATCIMVLILFQPVSS